MKKNKKLIIMMASIIIIAAVSVADTLAWIFTETNAVTNTFTPANVACSVEETFENNVKSNVSIKNDGNIPAFIRAYYVVTWQNSAGEIWPFEPKTTDYELVLNETDWEEKGGYYYYKSPVAAEDDLLTVVDEDNTPVFIEKCKVQAAAPAKGYTLHVEIIAQAIQAEPVSVVADAWDVSF